MDPKEILSFCVERGMLVDKEVLNLFKETSDISSISTSFICTLAVAPCGISIS